MNINESEIREVLKAVIDPEIMLNIIDLGLVYKIESNEVEKKINITMTLTSPGCPLGDVIMEDVRQVLLNNYIGWEPFVDLVWEPAWDPGKMTDKGREFLANR